jgi:hypothetical protein
MAWANKTGTAGLIHKTDWLQRVFLGVGVFDLIFFSYYLFTFELSAENMITDTLFSRGEYAAVLTVTLAVRLLGGVLFLMRYMHEYSCWMFLGVIGECMTLMGWYWLVLNKDTVNHFGGVGFFCLGSLVYSSVFIRLGWISHWHLRNLHQALMVFLIVSTAVLVVAFVSLWTMEQNQGGRGNVPLRAYIVEHAAYITHILFYLGFFSFHSPNPDLSPHVCAEYGAEMLVLDESGRGVEVCQPLMLPTIPENIP